MSELEQDAALGRLIREHSATKKKLAERAETIRQTADLLAAISQSLRGSPIDTPKAAMIASDLPSGFSADWVRGVVEEHADLAAQLEGQKIRLKPYSL